jgi:hypothetical protein
MTTQEQIDIIQAHLSGQTVEYIFYNAGYDWKPIKPSHDFNFKDHAYRIKPTSSIKQLDPDDFPPGTVMRTSDTYYKWHTIMVVTEKHVMLSGKGYITYEDLAKGHWQRRLPNTLTWLPCHK